MIRFSRLDGLRLRSVPLSYFRYYSLRWVARTDKWEDSVKIQRYSSRAGLLVLGVALGLGGASCTKDSAKDVHSSAPTDGGAGGVGDAGRAGDAGGVHDPGPVRVRVSGSAQKGPIGVGSSVTVFGLDPTLEPTGSAFPSQTEDSLGSFDVSANLAEDLIEVVIQGPFYDELTGRLSETSTVLRALAAVEPSTEIKVNLLTTVAKNRIRYLVGDGQDFDAAVVQAEQEVLNAFGIDGDGLEAFTSMDLTGSSASDAALIALSAILLQYADDHSSSEGEKVAQLSIAVSNIAKDLEEDGQLDDVGLRTKLPRAAVRLDVAAVAANLEQIYSGLGRAIVVPDIKQFVETVAAPAPWRFVPSPPLVEQSSHCVCATGGKIYIIGGTDNNEPAPYLLRYDPATGHWESRANLLDAQVGSTCSVVDGVIYAIHHGYPPSVADSVEAYDPAQDAWTRKASIPPYGPSDRASVTSATINGKIYVAGGVQNQPSDDLFVYDPAQDAWESLGPLPLATFGTTAAAVAGRLYLFGGYSSGGNHDALAAVYEYDPVTKTWSQRASMPKGRGFAGAVAIGGKIYVAGASDDGSGMEEYDPVMDSWTTKTSMNIRGGRGLAFNDVDGLAYVVGAGTTIEGPSIAQTYDPAKDR